MTVETVGGLSGGFSALLGSGTSSASSLVPDAFDVAINGRSFRLDTAMQGQFAHRRASNPALRQQSDQDPTPGEQSISREDLWRRSQSNWNHGAGQTYFDRADSDGAQFQTSRGVNVWDKWELKLLPTTTQSLASAESNLRLTTAGSITYVTDGAVVKSCPNPTAAVPVWTALTGDPGITARWITSDGSTVYVAYNTSGIYSFAAGAAAMTAYNTLPTNLVSYVKGRLMTAYDNSIYNVTSTAPPAALLTHPNAAFRWVGFAEGPANIYAAGYSGQRSLIYRIAITPDATALAAPVVAGELPTGEVVTSIKGYLGYLLIGSNLGVRIASIDGSGNLLLGALIRTIGTVYNFEPADRFVWFGLSSIDGVSSGLGRLDLSTFTSPLTPAYANDLETTVLGDVLSISSQSNRRVFSVAGRGVYAESTLLRTSGTLTSSRITYDIADDKVARFLDLRSSPLAGSVGVTVNSNGVSSAVGVFDEAGATRPNEPINAAQIRSDWFTVTLELNAAAGQATGPVVTRFTLRAYPAPTRSFTFTVPLIIADVVETKWGDPTYTDTVTDRDYLESLVRSQQLITYQEDGQGYTVLVDDSVWMPHHGQQDRRGRNGTLVLTMRETSD